MSLDRYAEKNKGLTWMEEFPFPPEMPAEAGTARSVERTASHRLYEYALRYLWWKWGTSKESGFFPLSTAVAQFRASRKLPPSECDVTVLGFRTEDVRRLSWMFGENQAERLLRRLDADLTQVYQYFCVRIQLRVEQLDRAVLVDLVQGTTPVEIEIVDPVISLVRTQLMRMSPADTREFFQHECGADAKSLVIMFVEHAVATEAHRGSCLLRNPMCGGMPAPAALKVLLMQSTEPFLCHTACRPAPWYLARQVATSHATTGPIDGHGCA
jgi:hypothetical protein